MSINVFQLIKHFSIETKLAEIRFALIIPIIALAFDNEFVVSNADFLRDNLLDQSLVDELPVALQGAKPFESSGALEAARNTAKLALRYLYGGPGPEGNIFNMPHVFGAFNQDLGDPNDPATSFDAQRDHSGLRDAIGGDDDNRADTGVIFVTLNLFFKVYREMVDTNTLDNEDNAIGLATALAGYVDPLWIHVQGDEKRTRFVLDSGDFTEIFRRLSGFLALVKGRLNGLLSAADEDRKAIKVR